MKRLFILIAAAIMLAAALAPASFASPAWSGDANGDDVINAKDVVAMMKHIVGDGSKLAPTADYNGDGKVNAKDVTLTMKYLVGCPVLTDPLLEAKYGVSAPDFEIPDPVTDKEVSAALFGFDPDAADNSAAFNSAAAYLRENPGTKLTIEKGVYRMGGAAVNFDGVKDCVIDGGGARFVYGATRYFNVTRCENIKFCNMTIAWDWNARNMFSVLLVKEVEKLPNGDQAVTFEFPDVDDAAYAMSETWYSSAILLDPADRKFTPTGVGFTLNDRVQICANMIRATFDKDETGSFEKDGLYLIRHIYAGAWTFYIGAHTSGAIFEDLTIHNAPLGFTALDYTENVRLTRVKIVPEDGRAMSTMADSIHLRDMYGHIIIEDCEVSRSGDDCVNIHDGIAVVRDYYKNELRIFGGVINPGDTITFYGGEDFKHTEFTAVVLETKDVTGLEHELILDRDCEDQVNKGDLIKNLTTNISHVIIKNSYFHDSEARGMILTASDALVENCRFEGGMEYAIKIDIDIIEGGWGEGAGAENIIIRNNEFDNCAHFTDGTNIYFQLNSTFSKTKHIYGECFKNIIISGNTFRNVLGKALDAKSFSHLTFYGNTIEWSAGELPDHCPVRSDAGKVVITGQYYDGSTIFGNTWITSDLTPEGYEPLKINPSKISMITVEVNTVK